MSETLLLPLNGGASDVRIGEDILAADGGILKRRGRLIYSGDARRGFPGLGQHFTGTGQARLAVSPSIRPPGLAYSGIGKEADGYGAADANAGGYLRLGRDIESAWYVFSGRIVYIGQTPAAISDPFFYCDTQAWDDADRSFFQITKSGGAWKVRANDHTFKPSAATRFPGWNENKYDETYWALSVRIGKTSEANTASFGQYGHFQFAGQSVDLRNLGGGWSQEPPQAGAAYTPGTFNPPSGANPAVNSSFAGGLNFGFGVTTPEAGIWGGFVITRMEITVGAALI